MVESLIDSLSQETKKKSFLLIILLLISIIAGLFYFQPGVGYEIISNGQHVGYARSKLDAELAVNSMKNHILEVKGSEADTIRAEFPVHQDMQKANYDQI